MQIVSRVVSSLILCILVCSWVGSCKRPDSKLDATIGLDALGRRVGADEAPVFHAFANWVNTFSVSAQPTPGDHPRNLSLELYLKSLPSQEERSNMIEIIDFEMARYNDLGIEDRLEGLAEAESRDIYEIIAVLLYSHGVQGELKNPFARFMRDFSQSQDENYLDEYAQEFLSGLSDVGSFAKLAEDLPKEKESFQKSLASYYKGMVPNSSNAIQNSQEARDSEARRIEAQGRLNASLNKLRSQLMQPGSQIYDPQIHITGIIAAFMHFQMMAFRSEKIEEKDQEDGSSGQLSPHAPDASFYSNSKSLSLQNQASSQGCANDLVLSRCPEGGQICVPRGYRCGHPRSVVPSQVWSQSRVQNQSNLKTNSGVDQIRIQTPSSKASFYCFDMDNLTPSGKIFCERTGSYASAQREARTGFGFDDFSSFNGSDWRQAAAEYKGQKANILLSHHSTPVQDQGPNGACTAYGLTHTIESEVNRSKGGFSFTSSAADFWSTYQTPELYTSLRQARSHSFQGDGQSVSLKSYKSIRNVKELLEALKSGRSLYAASGVNSSWMNNGFGRGDTLECGSDRGDGHAYSLAGFIVDESGDSGVLLVKNSWGSNWGHKGYAKLPFECLTQFNSAEFNAFLLEL